MQPSSHIPASIPRLIPLRAVISTTSLSRSKIYSLIKEGAIRPVHVGKKLAFVESEIVAFIEALIAARG